MLLRCRVSICQLVLAIIVSLMAVQMRKAAAMLLILLRVGSIFDSHKRRAVQPLMYVRLASLATETGVLGEGLLAALPSQIYQLLPVRGFPLSYM